MDKNFSHLVGVPYKTKDCWALAQAFYSEVLGITLTNYYGDIPPERWEKKILISSCKGDFVETKKPKFGDIVTIMLFGVECHLGIYVGNDCFLHTTDKTGSVIDRVGRWRKLISGFYTLEAKA